MEKVVVAPLKNEQLRIRSGFRYHAPLQLSPGMQVTVHGVQEDLNDIHGSHPEGVEVLVRIRLSSGQENDMAKIRSMGERR
jgi:hypothetical protein